MPGTYVAQRARGLAPELVGLERDRASVLAQDPRRELLDGGVFGDEDAVLELSRVPEGAFHPPGRVACELDARLADEVADLPRRPAAVLVDVEVGRDPEVALASRGEANVAADPRDAEGADVLPVEVLSDHVPAAVVREQAVRVDRALALPVAGDRVVRELDRALLRDRALELAEAARHLWRVVGVGHLDAYSRLRRGLVEPRAPEREVLERQPERLGIRELAFEQVERRLEGRELVVVQLELVEEVVLGSQRVELLAGELVSLRLQRHPERQQLGAVRVEPACEGLVGHLRVALDVGLHVAGGQWPALRHQVRDEGELPDQLVGVVRHQANLSD